MLNDWEQFLSRYPLSDLESNPVLTQRGMLCNLTTTFGLMKVSGNDAKKFLQGQLTCDLETISPNQSCMGAHCNPQGRVISLFYLFQFQDAYYLLMPYAMASVTITALKKYIIFYKKAELEVNHHLVTIGLMGHVPPHATEDPIAVIPIKTPFSLPRYLLVGELTTMKKAWETLAKQTPCVNAIAWKYGDMLANIPAIYPETSGKFLPHEINLQAYHAISFEKGCYTGQEIIARMHYRGKLKTHLYLAQLTSKKVPLPGADIYFLHHQNRQIGGIIVDSYHQGDNHYLVLLIAEEANAKNNHLFLNQDDDFFKWDI